MKILIILLTVFGILYSSVCAFAAHPLITDDTGTQGAGRIQIELNGECGNEKEDGVNEKAYITAGTFTYGLADSLDLALGMPYQYIKTEGGEETGNKKGISDAFFILKWRFLETNIFNFAIKSGISFPTGDYKKGLGSGKTAYSGFLINTINLEMFLFHVNFGYIRNENKLEEEKNLWHASLAGEYSIIKKLRIVLNIGTEKNSDPDSSGNPVFLLGGLIFSPNENFNIDAGYKYGLTDEETNYTILGGLTFRI